jgi:hypothetical protein
VDLLASHHENGRRFVVFETVGEGPKVAVGLDVSAPDWPADGRAFKLFTFGNDGKVVLIQDCLDESNALDGLG